MPMWLRIGLRLQSAAWDFTSCSKRNLQRRLGIAGVVGLGISKQPEARVGKSRLGLAEPRSVKRVERFETELNLHLLLDIEGLEHRRVHHPRAHLADLRPARAGHPQRVVGPLDPGHRLVAHTVLPY